MHQGIRTQGNEPATLPHQSQAAFPHGIGLMRVNAATTVWSFGVGVHECVNVTTESERRELVAKNMRFKTGFSHLEGAGIADQDEFLLGPGQRHVAANMDG